MVPGTTMLDVQTADNIDIIISAISISIKTFWCIFFQFCQSIMQLRRDSLWDCYSSIL